MQNYRYLKDVNGFICLGHGDIGCFTRSELKWHFKKSHKEMLIKRSK